MKNFVRTGPIVLLAATALLQGCATAVVTGAATGAAVVHDRRTVGSVIEDEAIELKTFNGIRQNEELYKQSHINVTSYNGIVLLSGETPTPAFRATAERIALGIPKVRTVHNELSIAAPSSLLTRSSDGLISTKVKTRLFTDKEMDPTRVKVTTENGTVYLMGIVHRREADMATEVARHTSGVQRVVKLFEYIN